MTVTIDPRSIVGLDFGIEFAVDEYKRSLSAATQTRTIMLFEPALALAARHLPVEEALDKHRWFGVEVADNEPIIRLLQQRFDLPLPGPAAERFDVGPQAQEESVRGFVEGAQPLQQYGSTRGSSGGIGSP
jgi:hypothetical protein